MQIWDAVVRPLRLGSGTVQLPGHRAGKWTPCLRRAGPEANSQAAFRGHGSSCPGWSLSQGPEESVSAASHPFHFSSGRQSTR
jgi:hypothetical protein